MGKGLLRGEYTKFEVHGKVQECSQWLQRFSQANQVYAKHKTNLFRNHRRNCKGGVKR